MHFKIHLLNTMECNFQMLTQTYSNEKKPKKFFFNFGYYHSQLDTGL